MNGVLQADEQTPQRRRV